MKVCIVGGGAVCTPELVEGLALWHATGGALRVCLYDIDTERLNVVGGFCQRLVAALNSSLLVELQDKLEPAIRHSDFVVCSLRVGGAGESEKDLALAASLGLAPVEDLGAPALAAALRTIPQVLNMARTVRAVAPEAWVLNLTQPVGIVTEAIARFATVRTLGISHAPLEMRVQLAQSLRLETENLRLDWMGLHDLSWVRHVIVQGRDVLPEFLRSLRGSSRKGAGWTEWGFPAELLQRLKTIPSRQLIPYYVGWHSPVFRLDRAPASHKEDLDSRLLDYYRDTSECLKPPLLWEKPAIRTYRGAVEVMKALVHREGSDHVVNTLNLGTVDGFPADAVFEVPCRIRRDGVFPSRIGEVEESIVGLIHQVKSSERLAIEAAVARNENSMYLALLNHPLVPSEQEARGYCAGLLARGYF